MSLCMYVILCMCMRMCMWMWMYMYMCVCACVYSPNSLCARRVGALWSSSSLQNRINSVELPVNLFSKV